jgi:UDP-2-acetamido-3-amino-2,3-dideoxy-glucuronate N-acetyltransferase
MAVNRVELSSELRIDESAAIHETAIVDRPVSVGARTRIWHFCHVMSGARIGSDCSLGHGCFVGGAAILGNGVRLQNHVSIFDGVELEDDVFCGPSAVFTNVSNPRAAVSRRSAFQRTVVRRGATVGANATVLPGITLGRYCFVAAGAVVTGNVASFELVVGTPARRLGWVSRRAERLSFENGRAECAATGEVYLLAGDEVTLAESSEAR